MKKVLLFGLACTIAIFFTACKDKNKKTEDPVNPDVPVVEEDGYMQLQGGEGGAMAINSVYVDFSTATQVSIERASWDLALHCGEEFGVKMNSTRGGRAVEAEAGTTITDVLTDEQHEMYVQQLAPQMGTGDFSIADDINCDTDLSGTIIKSNKLYIYCNDEIGKEIYKVQVAEMNSSSYMVVFSAWNSSEIAHVEITKDAAYNFVGISFETKQQVNIQPKKEAWDMVWGRTTYTSAMAPGMPFNISDVVFLNTKLNVQAKEIMISDAVTYESFTKDDVAGIEFESAIDVIGTNWRKGGGPNSSPHVKTDRFYLIKDVEGNVYKLRFISMCEGSDGGKRGYPELEYSLLVKK